MQQVKYKNIIISFIEVIYHGKDEVFSNRSGT